MEIVPNESAKSVKLVASWQVTGREEQERIVGQILSDFPWMRSRPKASYVREWRAHNRMHSWGWFRDHTADCDLDAGEKLWRRICYFFLSF